MGRADGERGPATFQLHAQGIGLRGELLGCILHILQVVLEVVESREQLGNACPVMLDLPLEGHALLVIHVRHQNLAMATVLAKTGWLSVRKITTVARPYYRR